MDTEIDEIFCGAATIDRTWSINTQHVIMASRADVAIIYCYYLRVRPADHKCTYDNKIHLV